jgi:hypothetical protein
VAKLARSAAGSTAVVSPSYYRPDAPQRRLPTLLAGVRIVAVLAAAEALLLGGHLLHGGLYTDDWPLASIQHQTGSSGLLADLAEANHERPLGFLYQVLTTTLSTTNPHLHALWGLLTLLAAASASYMLLRSISLKVWEAVAVALLFMVFPFADSAWLWYAASHGYLAIALAACGGTLALAGLRREGRAALAFHGGALALFAASILTYQTAAAVICLSLLVYLPRTERRTALALWATDVLVVAASLGLPRLITGSAGSNVPDRISSLSEQVHHARLMANQGLTLLGDALVPFGAPHRNVVLPIALVIFIAGLLLLRRAGSSYVPSQLRRWLWLIAGGSLVVAGAYAVYVPAPIALYQPLAKGSENRVNVLASLGFAMVLFGLAMVSGALLARLLRRPPAWAPALGLGLALAAFVGYARHTRNDIAEWDRAGAIQRSELAQLRAAGRPAPGTTIYAFDGVGATAPNVYAFRVTWDLNSAVQLLWNDPTLHGYPIFAGTQMVCAGKQVVPEGPANGDSAAQAGAYGHVTYFSFGSRRTVTIDGPLQCSRAARAFVPGPVEG